MNFSVGYSQFYDCCTTVCSDVRFSVGEEKQIIYGHRCILAAR